MLRDDVLVHFFSQILSTQHKAQREHIRGHVEKEHGDDAESLIITSIDTRFVNRALQCTRTGSGDPVVHITFVCNDKIREERLKRSIFFATSRSEEEEEKKKNNQDVGRAEGSDVGQLG